MMILLMLLRWLPLFLLPSRHRAVTIQRRRAGELVGPALDVASRSADVAAVLLAAEEPTHELRIFGSPFALSRIGANGPLRDIRGEIWEFMIRKSPTVTQWITCYAGAPS
jgi:hypothetical protein